MLAASSLKRRQFVVVAISDVVYLGGYLLTPGHTDISPTRLREGTRAPASVPLQYLLPALGPVLRQL